MAFTHVTCPSCEARNRISHTAAGRPRCGKCKHDLPWLDEVSGADFEAVVASSPLPTLVDLWAPWCGPCRVIAPALEKLATDRAGSLRIVKVNVDHAPEVSARLRVQGIPTMVLFHRGAEISRQVGAMPGDRIARWVDSATAGSS
jgi:thioredoxin 2